MGEKTNRIPELFGSLVFNEHKMEQYIPEEAMKVWRQCLKSGQPLPRSVAKEIAVGPSFATNATDTVCATFKMRKE